MTKHETGAASINLLTAASSYLVPETLSSLRPRPAKGRAQIQMCVPALQRMPRQSVWGLGSAPTYSQLFLGLQLLRDGRALEHLMTFQRMLKDTWPHLPASPASQGVFLVALFP